MVIKHQLALVRMRLLTSLQSISLEVSHHPWQKRTRATSTSSTSSDSRIPVRNISLKPDRIRLLQARHHLCNQMIQSRQQSQFDPRIPEFRPRRTMFPSPLCGLDGFFRDTCLAIHQLRWTLHRQKRTADSATPLHLPRGTLMPSFKRTFRNRHQHLRLSSRVMKRRSKLKSRNLLRPTSKSRWRTMML